MKAAATKRLPGEGFKRAWPLCEVEALQGRRLIFIKMDESVKAEVEKLFGGRMNTSSVWPV